MSKSKVRKPKSKISNSFVKGHAAFDARLIHLMEEAASIKADMSEFASAAEVLRDRYSDEPNPLDNFALCNEVTNFIAAEKKFGRVIQARNDKWLADGRAFDADWARSPKVARCHSHCPNWEALKNGGRAALGANYIVG